MEIKPPYTLPGSKTWKVVIIGASYGGLSAAANLLDLCAGRPARFTYPCPESHEETPTIPVQITILDERDGFFHTIGAPLALTNPSYTSAFWKHTSQIPGLQHPWVKFIHGSACAVDLESKTLTLLASGSAKRSILEYDRLIVASGLRRVWPVVPQSLRKRDYEEEVGIHINKVKGNEEVVVIGGGAVGIEMATEIKHTYPSLHVTLIHSRAKLLSSEPLPEQFKDQVLSAVQDSGVNVILQTRVVDIQDTPNSQQLVLLSNGVRLSAGYVLKAVSKPVPSTSFLPRGVLDPNGYVFVTKRLNLTLGGGKDHYAIGDITNIPGIKRCSSAMQMGHYAAVNIHQDILARTYADDVGFEPKYLTMTEVYPGMGLAVGSTGLYWNPDDGIVKGEEALREMFDDDLGWSKCWNYMQLGKAPPM